MLLFDLGSTAGRRALAESIGLVFAPALAIFKKSMRESHGL